MLGGAIYAQGRVGLMLNVRKQDLAAVLAVLPALQKPTISTLSDGEWVAVNTIIEETTAWRIMPQLKTAKAEGIVEYPLNKVVLVMRLLTGRRAETFVHKLEQRGATDLGRVENRCAASWMMSAKMATARCAATPRSGMASSQNNRFGSRKPRWKKLGAQFQKSSSKR